MVGTRLSCLIAAIVFLSAFAHALVIDDFSSGEFSYTASSPYDPSDEFIQGAIDFASGGRPPIGLSRSFALMAASGAEGSTAIYSVDPYRDQFKIDSQDGEHRYIDKYFRLSYGSPEAPLGIDLTSGGADRFRITFYGDAPGIGFSLDVHGIVEGQLKTNSISVGGTSSVGPAYAILEIPFFGDLATFQNVVSIQVNVSGLQQDTVFDMIETVTAPLQGDLNRDGVVDIEDYRVWRQNYFGVRWISAYDILSPATGGGLDETTVDANHDGQVNAADYTIWRDAYDAQQAALATPEPSTMVSLMAIGAGLMAFQRRQRC